MDPRLKAGLAEALRGTTARDRVQLLDDVVDVVHEHGKRIEPEIDANGGRMGIERSRIAEILDQIRSWDSPFRSDGRP